MRVGGREVPARWAFLGLGVVLFLVGWLAWQPFPAGIWHDDGVYALLGRALARGEGLRYGGVAGAPPAVKFPPLYPLTLAGVWAVASEPARAVPLMELLNLALLAGAASLFARYLHRRLELRLEWALATAALAFLSAELWAVAWIPLSEPLFLLLFVAGAAAAATLEARPESRRALLLFLLAFALAVHVRTAGIVLVAAAAAALLLRGRRARAAALVGSGVAILLPWTLWSARAGERIPEPLRDVLGSYGGWLVGRIADAPGAFVASLHPRAVDLLDRLTDLLVPLPPDSGPWAEPLRWGSLVVLVPALVLGMDRVWRRAPSAVLLAGAYLVMVWIWPFGDSRLLVPVLPFVVLLLVEGFRWSGEGTELAGRGLPVEGEAGADPEPGRGTARLRLGWRGAGVLWAGSFVVLSVASLALGWSEEPYRIRSAALGRALEAVEARTPPDAVVGAPELWAGIHVHSGRTVVPSARFLPGRSDGPVWGTPEEQFELWSATGVQYVLVEHRGRVHGRTLERLTEACGSGAARTLDEWQEIRLVRLEWDGACRARLVRGGR